MTTERELRRVLSFISHQAADGRQHEKILEPEGNLKNLRSPRSSENPWQLLTCVGSGAAGSVIHFFNILGMKHEVHRKMQSRFLIKGGKHLSELYNFYIHNAQYHHLVEKVLTNFYVFYHVLLIHQEYKDLQ